MPNPKQERFLMREYKSYLMRETGLRASFRTNPHDPPDFWLTTGGRKYAVEMTNIVHEDDRRISEAQWYLVREAEREALRNGALSGRYVVTFRSPWTEREQKDKPKPGQCAKFRRLWATREQKVKFKQSIIDFVTRTAIVAKSSPQEIVIAGRSLGDIQKYAGSGAEIHPCGGGLDELGGSVDDVREQLSPLVECAIRDKAKKMASHRPAVLVLYDNFLLAEASAFTACVRAVPEASLFEDIYVVQEKGRGFRVPVEKRLRRK